MSLCSFFAHLYTMWLSLSDAAVANWNASSYFIVALFYKNIKLVLIGLPYFLNLLKMSFVDIKAKILILDFLSYEMGTLSEFVVPYFNKSFSSLRAAALFRIAISVSFFSFFPGRVHCPLIFSFCVCHKIYTMMVRR